MTNREREVMRLVNQQDRSHLNCLRINVGNTFLHELSKFKLFWELRSNGVNVIAEARCKEKRTDLLDLSSGICWEIKCSETQKSIELKREFFNKIGLILKVIGCKNDK